LSGGFDLRGLATVCFVIASGVSMRQILAMVLPLALSFTDANETAPVGLLRDVTFDQYSSLSSVGEMHNRLLSPLVARRLGAAPPGPQTQPVDLAHERFALYVPKQAPPNGYGLLVFVPPWEQAAVPAQWTDALDRHGMIFVSAARSGNGADVMQRREPLALLAASNVLHRYPVDLSRVYVGGFSGGSRVAERLALAYPDLFHGALLNAGSDPIGTPEVPLPPTSLLERFQTSSRLVYLTGKNDSDHLDMDRRSRRAMNDWCVFDITPLVVPWSGHETPNEAAFSRGINALEEHDPTDPEKLNACRERYREELKGDVERTRAMVTQGDRTDAAVELQKIDARFGGLAAPFYYLAN
jgi:hypothetical protein